MDSSNTSEQRVINVLMQVKLNESDILALQECIPVISDSVSNNKRLPDGNRKDPTTNEKTIVFPALDLSTKHNISTSKKVTQYNKNYST